VLVVAPAALGAVGDLLIFVVLAVFAVGVAFLGLGIWARYQPLPPTVIALVLYVIVFIIDIVSAIQQGAFNAVMLVRIAIIIALAKGIQAANKYNELKTPRDDY